MARLRTIFMGTPEFAVPCLKRLIEISDVLAVVTQPDKRQGRGQHIVFSPVKSFALEKGLTVYQPDKIKQDEAVIETLESLKPDVIVVVAYGQILPERVLDIPELACINVHASLLPRYRGAAPMQWAIINGEVKTGVTTMKMDAGLDTGDMILKSEIDITEDMNLETLHDLLMAEGAELLAKTIAALEKGELNAVKQDDSLANYAPMITKETGRIDWEKDARTIHNLVRGLDSWPGAYCSRDGKIFKIWKSRITDYTGAGKPGEIIALTNDGIIVGTGKGLLEILEIQAPGKKRIRVADYVRGNKLELHSYFE